MTNLSTKPGLVMLSLAWITGIFLFTQFFASEENKAINPNTELKTTYENGFQNIQLIANRKGHYVLNGFINDKPALFMLDTGATDVVIPADLADFYRLKPQGKQIGLTANGQVEIEKTNIDMLSIGSINLYNVRASINPGMQKTQAILLGMSAIKHFDLAKKDETLTLTYRPE